MKSLDGTGLEDKLSGVIVEVRSRLEQGELTNDEFFNFIYKSLKREGMLKDLSITIGSQNLGAMASEITSKLGVEGRTGIKKDYRLFPHVPLSEKAKNDISAYEKLKAEVGEYLRQTIGKKPISEIDFEKLVKMYLSKKLSKVYFPGFGIRYIVERRDRILSYLVGTYKSEFNILPQSKFMGAYTRKSIKEAIKKV